MAGGRAVQSGGAAAVELSPARCCQCSAIVSATVVCAMLRPNVGPNIGDVHGEEWFTIGSMSSQWQQQQQQQQQPVAEPAEPAAEPASAAAAEGISTLAGGW